MAQHYQNEEFFNILGLSEATVHKLRTAPLDKLGLPKLEICRALQLNGVDFQWRAKKGILENSLIELMLQKPLPPDEHADPQPIGQPGPLAVPNGAEDRAFVCKICLERDIQYLFSLCGHLGICSTCKRGMAHEDMLNCPACRRPHHVDNLMRVYLM